MSGQVKTDPLFLGLTRPAMIFGVTYPYLLLNFVLTTVYIVAFSDIRIIAFTVVFHIACMFVCKKEPLGVELVLTKLRKCPSVPNKDAYFGYNSYGLF